MNNAPGDISERPARPATGRTSTRTSLAAPVARTLHELRSPPADSIVPTVQRPGCARKTTSATLKEESEGFFSTLSDNAANAETEAETETIAFAFDIDGVLVRSTEALPGAHDTIEMLQKNNIPFIFLTNGGGSTERAHVARVGMRLDLDLDEKQFVQSHSPFHDLVPKYHDKTILVLGGHGDQIRDLAHAYGFNKVVTSSDLMAEWEHIHPFPELTKDKHAEHGRRLEYPRGVEIAAILVWSSPRDWCLDLQVISDLLLSSGGNFGKKSALHNSIHLPNNGFLQDNQPKLYFANPDFEWSTRHDHPRFAQGAFREALKGVWSYATKGKAELEYTVIGKPTEAAYTYGEKVLYAYNESLNERLGINRKIRTVYMIGDNPESDIRGANAFQSRIGAEWRSILVESGVYEAGTKPTYQPTFVAKNVKDAVEQALAREDKVVVNTDLAAGRLALLDMTN